MNLLPPVQPSHMTPARCSSLLFGCALLAAPSARADKVCYGGTAHEYQNGPYPDGYVCCAQPRPFGSGALPLVWACPPGKACAPDGQCQLPSKKAAAPPPAQPPLSAGPRAKKYRNGTWLDQSCDNRPANDPTWLQRCGGSSVSSQPPATTSGSQPHQRPSLAAVLDLSLADSPGAPGAVVTSARSNARFNEARARGRSLGEWDVEIPEGPAAHDWQQLAPFIRFRVDPGADTLRIQVESDALPAKGTLQALFRYQEEVPSAAHSRSDLSWYAGHGLVKRAGARESVLVETTTASGCDRVTDRNGHSSAACIAWGPGWKLAVRLAHIELLALPP